MPQGDAYEWRESQLNEPGNLRSLMEGVDAVIHLAGRAHLAARHIPNELDAYRRANTESTAMLADAALACGVKRFIFISSIGVNGPMTGASPFTELSTPNPATAYAISKLEAERELTVRTGRGMDIVILRPALVYAANAPGNIHRLLDWIAAERPLPLGAINNARSFIALENLVDLILRCMQHPAAADQLFLAADDDTLSTTELAVLLAQGMGKTPCMFALPSPLFRLMAAAVGRRSLHTQLYCSLVIDNSKARKLLEWTPPLDARTAVKNTGAEYYARIHRP